MLEGVSERMYGEEGGMVGWATKSVGFRGVGGRTSAASEYRRVECFWSFLVGGNKVSANVCDFLVIDAHQIF